MNYLDTVILGIVEGLTEFLPISSTGHLILTSSLLGLKGEAVDTFNVFIQLGAILAVVVLYHQRFKMLFQNGNAGDFAGLRGWILLAVTSLPAMVVGFLAHDFIKVYLFNPFTVVLALLTGGIAILVLERFQFQSSMESLDQLSFPQAIRIGFFQCLALWPGMSRSASTIIGGMVSGLDRKLAAEYSFIAAVPVMFLATSYDLFKTWDKLSPNDFWLFGLGFIVAFVSAIIAIRVFIHLLQSWSLRPFGFYRIAMAVGFLWIL